MSITFSKLMKKNNCSAVAYRELRKKNKKDKKFSQIVKKKKGIRTPGKSK